MSLYSWSSEVDYADTDAMAVVHHSRYLRYFERTRINFLKKHGIHYAQLEKSGFFLPVLKAEMTYSQPLGFDQAFEVRLELKQASDLRVHLQYDVLSKNLLCVRGETQHAWCRRKSNGTYGACRGPQEWRMLWPKLKDKNW